MLITFEWDAQRDAENQAKHGICFETAQYAFFDEQRFIIHDEKHSDREERWFCIGKVKNQILTVRFTYRAGAIRIFGAAEWRKWRQFYEERRH